MVWKRIIISVSKLGYHLPLVISHAKQLKSDRLRESSVQQLTQGSQVETNLEKTVLTIVPPDNKEVSPVSVEAKKEVGHTFVSLFQGLESVAVEVESSSVQIRVDSRHDTNPVEINVEHGTAKVFAESDSRVLDAYIPMHGTEVPDLNLMLDIVAIEDTDAQVPVAKEMEGRTVINLFEIEVEEHH